MVPMNELSRDVPIVVAGAGGFIGGHLVSALSRRGFSEIHGIDIKPLDEWFQIDTACQNIRADLRNRHTCFELVPEESVVINLAADMGGMGYNQISLENKLVPK